MYPRPSLKGLTHTALALGALCLTALFAGCGGSDNNHNGQPGNYAGNYTGTVSLASSRTGALGVTVLSSGQAIGQLTISSAAPQNGKGAHALAITLPFSTTFLTGAASFTNGKFDLTGTVSLPGEPAIPISITGTLPLSNGASTWTLKVGNETVTGTVTPGGTLIITPGGTTTGTTTGTNTGTTTGTTGTSTTGTTGTTGTTTGSTTGSTVTTGTTGTATTGTTSGTTTTGTTGSTGIPGSVTFSDVSGTNANTATYAAQGVLTHLTTDASGKTTLSALISPTRTSEPTRYVDFKITFDSTPVIGRPLKVQGPLLNNETNVAALFYSEFGSGHNRVWQATGGSLTIDAINGTSVTFHLQGVTMTPTPGGFQNDAAGTFTIDFSGTSVDALGS